MKDVTEKLLRIDNHACVEGYQWWLDNQQPADAKLIIKKLMSEDHFDWSNWLIVRLMNRDQKVQYAIYAAELVIDVYEKKYPDDKRPRKAIEAAKNYLKDKSTDNKKAAAAAYDDAAAADDDAADDAAAYAAAAAAYAAAAADDDDAAAAYAAAAAYDAAARKELQIKIIKYGMKFCLYR